MNNDSNFTFYTQYSTNAAPCVSFSVPLNTTNSQPLANWSTSVAITLQNDSQFSISTAPTNSDPGHFLVAYYTFDDSNNLGADSSGYGNDLSGQGNCCPSFYWTNNSIAGGGAVQFINGSWFSLPDTMISNIAGSYSISLWVNTTQTYGDDTDDGFAGAGIVYENNSGSANNTIPMALNGSKLGFFTGNPDLTLHSTNSINSGNWTHIVVTRDQPTGQKLIYINGVLDSEGVGSTNLLNASTELLLGENPAFEAGFVGIMDDVQFYVGVLSASNVAFLYAHPGTNVPDVLFTNEVPLPFALDAPNLAWTTSGNPGWVGETGFSADGVAAAGSGAPPDGVQTSTLQTTLTGEGILSFWWATIANQNDPFDLEFDTNGLYANDIFGYTPWQSYSLNFGPGTTTLTWFTDNFYYGPIVTNDAGFVGDFSFESITGQPSNAVFYAGTTAAAIVSGYGNPAMQVDWQLNDSQIAGASNLAYIVTNCATTNSGVYQLTLNNDAGTISSIAATVTVTNDPALPASYNVLQRAIPSAGGYSLGQQLVVASNGDLCVAGNFTGTNTLGTNVLASTSNALFVGRLSSSGNWLWARQGGGSISSANVIAVDASNQLVVAGSYQGTAQFGSFTLTNAGSYDAFLARYDSNGNCNLAFRFGSSGSDFIQGLTFDPAGNIYVSGVVGDSVQAFGTNATVHGTNQPVVASYTSSGALRWVLNGAGSSLAYADGLRYLGGSLYFAGWRTGLLTLGTNSLAATNTHHSYLARCGTNGVCTLLNGIASADTNFSIYNDFPSMCYGPSNTLYLAGNFQGSNGTFGSNTLTNPTGNNSYVARFDANANFLMARVLGDGTTFADCLSGDAAGNVYVGGTFSGVTDFGGRSLFNGRGPGFNGTDLGNFAAKYTSAGALAWVRGTEAVTGGGSISYNAGVDVDSSGTVYEFAPLFGTVYFGTNQLADALTNAVVTRIAAPAVSLAVTLIDAAVSGTNFSFAFISTAGHTNSVLSATNLINPAWTNLTNIAGDGTLKTIVVPAKTPSQRYFRVSTQ